MKRERSDQAIRTDSWLAEAPELVIEVASPGNRKLQRKAALYVEHGAEQVWIVYPKQGTVSVFTSDGTTEARIGQKIEFKNISVPIAALFPDS